MSEINTIVSGGVEREIKDSYSRDKITEINTELEKIASATELGRIKVGENLTIDENSVLSAEAGGTEVIANPILSGTETELTGIQIDDTKYKVSGESYTLPTASTSTLGGVKIDGTTEELSTYRVLEYTKTTD